MSATPTRTLRVFLHTWDVYETTVRAHTPEHAEAIAQSIYETQHVEGFDWFNGGDDGFQIDERGSA